MAIATNIGELHPSTLLVPILALLGTLLCLPPLALHVRIGNMPISILIGSVMLVNLCNFFNAIIWPDDTFRRRYGGAGLCDLEVKVFIGAAASGAGSTMCIFRQLSKAFDTSTAVGRESKSQRQLTRVIEAVACIGIAFHSMAMHYIVQPSRYWLLPVLGCGVSLDPSWAGVVLIAVWPLLLYVVAAVYAGLAAIRLLRHRQEVSAVLSASSTLRSRYFRLFAFASVFLAINLSASVFTFMRNGLYHLRPYSWSAVHPKAWSHIIRKVAWEQSKPWDGTDRYVQIAGAYIIFAFWGLGREAKVLYWSILERTGKAKIWHRFSNQSARSSITTGSETSTTTMLSKMGVGERGSSVSVTELDDYILY